ncbi:hypothetical protein FPV67DRAFT_1525238 [Lyophyllum atratum]|nr:hypothetical protein FPV67DRAFT_1525238 [Lyophyllum atratum]
MWGWKVLFFACGWSVDLARSCVRALPIPGQLDAWSFLYSYSTPQDQNRPSRFDQVLAWDITVARAMDLDASEGVSPSRFPTYASAEPLVRPVVEIAAPPVNPDNMGVDGTRDSRVDRKIIDQLDAIFKETPGIRSYWNADSKRRNTFSTHSKQF